MGNEKNLFKSISLRFFLSFFLQEKRTSAWRSRIKRRYKMKSFWVILLIGASVAITSALKCYGPDLTKAKPCTALDSKSVDVTKCKEITCSSGQMCLRSTGKANNVASVTLGGCMPATKAECKSVGTGAASVEQCICDKDLCNGAPSTIVSMTAVGVSLVTFIAIFYARG